MSGLPITPETKVADLLEAYPELEDELIAAAAVFAKLRNPVLRRTIARVTTLRKAAEVGGLSARELVLRLRRAAGLDAGEERGEGDEPERSGAEDRPALWVDPGRVVWTIDADELLAAGTEPVAAVERRAVALTADELGLIRASFRPAPLIELLERQGFRVAVVRSGGSYAVFVGR